MGFIIKVLVTAVAVYVAAYLIHGVHISDIKTTVIVALILALLNTFIKPILIILTIPITIVTLGLFLLIINALMVKWSADIVQHFHIGGFTVDGWWPALLVSLVVTVVTYILESILERG
ncbi:MAG: phage holin family protein [Flavisolibacter sp.]